MKDIYWLALAQDIDIMIQWVSAVSASVQLYCLCSVVSASKTLKEELCRTILVQMLRFPTTGKEYGWKQKHQTMHYSYGLHEGKSIQQAHLPGFVQFRIPDSNTAIRRARPTRRQIYQLPVAKWVGHSFLTSHVRILLSLPTLPMRLTSLRIMTVP